MINDDKINPFKKFILRKREIKGKQEELTKSQKEVLLDYTKDGLNEGFSPNTIKSRLNIIKSFAYHIKKDFKEITKEDIKEYRDLKRDLKLGALNNILSVFKVFFKWLYKVEENGKYPEVVDWIKIKPPQQSEIRDSDLISFEEVKNILIPACHNFRDKCLIMLMRETGARINEILAANVGDVRIESDRAYIKLLISKQRNRVKNYREMVLIDTYYYLQHWLRDHPLKADFNKKKDIALFVDKRGKRLLYTKTYAMLQRLKEESGFKKSLHPHLFRHSQASDMAKILTDAELRIFGGWAKTSQIIARYTHVTSDDVNEKRLESIGRIKPEQKKIAMENLKPCPRCDEMVDYNKSKFCGKCGMSLDERVEITEHTQKEKVKGDFESMFRKFIEKEKKKLREELKEELSKKK
ncbi:MAG: site-specific integrase [Nanoarchaeota archaeon]